MIQPNEVDNKSALKIILQLALMAPSEQHARQLTYVAKQLSSQMTRAEVELTRTEVIETLRCEMSEDMDQIKKSYEEVHGLIWALRLPTID